MPNQYPNQTEEPADTTKKGIDFSGIYEKIRAVSFSLRMTDDVQLYMQNECDNDKSAEELKNLLEGVIALTKITTALSKKKQSAVLNLLENIKLNNYDKTTMLDLKITGKQVEEIRKQKVF